jgi:hypothetical protein
MVLLEKHQHHHHHAPQASEETSELVSKDLALGRGAYCGTHADGLAALM